MLGSIVTLLSCYTLQMTNTSMLLEWEDEKTVSYLVQGSHVVIGYKVDNAFQVTQIFFASKRIEDRCLEWLKDASWMGMGTILAAASATGTVGKSIATLALEAFCWAQITSGRSMDVRPLNALAEGECQSWIGNRTDQPGIAFLFR